MKVYLEFTEGTGYDRVLAFSEELAPYALSEKTDCAAPVTLAGIRTGSETFEDDLQKVLKEVFSLSVARGEKNIVIDLDSFPDESARSYDCNAVLEAVVQLKEDIPADDFSVHLLTRRELEEVVPQAVMDAVMRAEKTVQKTSFSEAGNPLREEFEEYSKDGSALTFRQYLSALIEEKKIKKDSLVYRAAGISKSTFSKIMSYKRNYKPSKPTVAALAIGLRLSLEEAQKFFHAAGFHLGKSEITDKIVRFYLEKQIYDLNEINDCLYYYGIPLLGERTREEVKLMN